MTQQITITNTGADDLPTGEIVKFDVIARCPHCDNETMVIQSELRNRVAQCQHCDEDFKIYLE